MKVLTGHLTATEKKVIKAILTAGLTEAGVKNKNYFLTESNGIYTVKIQQKDKGLIPCPGTKTRASIYTHTFSL